MPTSKIMGAHFRPPAKILIANAPSNAKLTLTPEPSNPYDSNAIAIWLSFGEIPESQYDFLSEALPGHGTSLEECIEQDLFHIGYIAKEIAAGTLVPEGHPATLYFDGPKGIPMVRWAEPETKPHE